jgi:hypothetical protein
LVLSLTAFKKIRLWTCLGADRYNVEVSGLGLIKPKHQGLFVSDVWLIRPEKIGAAHVDMLGSSVQELMMEVLTRSSKYKHLRTCVEEYYTTGVVSDFRAFDEFTDLLARSKGLKTLRFHWHSHAKFGVSWSGVDEATARHDFCPDANWTVSLVTNQKGHFLARQDFPKTRHEPRHNLSVWLFLGLPRHISRKYRQIFDTRVAEVIEQAAPENPPILSLR